jgi:tryptophanyl-tRNA synthetase
LISAKRICARKLINLQGDPKMSDSESTPILIEFSPRPGVEAVAIFNTNPEEIRRKSEEALNNAMKNIEEMANRVSALQKKIPAEFSEVEVEFGIKFDWKVGALLAEAGTEASINVTLTWSRPQN